MAGNNGATPPFAQESQAFSAAEHREALARAYPPWRRYLAGLDPYPKTQAPTRKANMPSAEPSPDKPAKPKPRYGTSAWRKEMYRAHAARKRAAAHKKAQPKTARPGSAQ